MRMANDLINYHFGHQVIWWNQPQTDSERHLSVLLNGPRQANLVLIAYASSEGSGEPAHPCSLARTFAARSYKQWIKRNLQTESQIPGPSEWLGMRSWNLSWRNARRHKFAWRGSNAKNWCLLLACFAHYTLVILLIICILHLMNPSSFKYIRVIHQQPFQFRQKGWGHSVGCSQYSTISVCPCNEPAHEIMELIRACAVSPEPLLLAHMKYRSRRRVRQKIRHLARLDGCTCTFEEWVYGGWKVP